jgi:uncharacterized membrane protein
MPLWARFVGYGLLGWCIEVAFTGVSRFMHERDLRLTGQSYLWMLPIYGLGGLLLEGIRRLAEPAPLIARGLCYMTAIYAVEFSAGFLIRRLVGHSPWNYYGRTRWQVLGLIRLDYAPFWFAVGLGFEWANDLMMRARLA